MKKWKYFRKEGDGWQAVSVSLEYPSSSLARAIDRERLDNFDLVGAAMTPLAPPWHRWRHHDIVDATMTPWDAAMTPRDIRHSLLLEVFFACVHHFWPSVVQSETTTVGQKSGGHKQINLLTKRMLNIHRFHGCVNWCHLLLLLVTYFALNRFLGPHTLQYTF